MIERACFRIGPLAALHARGIDAARVDGGSDHVVAGLDPKHRLDGAGKRVVEFRRLKPMGFGESGSGQRQASSSSFMRPPGYLRGVPLSGWIVVFFSSPPNSVISPIFFPGDGSKRAASGLFHL